MTVTPARTLVVVLATARLTRLVTRDWVGEWFLIRPAKRWAERLEGPLAEDEDPHEAGHRHKLVTGLDCPFCVGFWLGGAVLVGEAVVGRSKLWRLVTGALALNYVVGHLSSKID